MKIDNCLLQEQLQCATQSAGTAQKALQSNTDHDSTCRQTKQIEGDICLIEMSVADYARQHIFEGKTVTTQYVRNYLPLQSLQSTRFTGTSLKCLSVFSIVYPLYTFYTIH